MYLRESIGKDELKVIAVHHNKRNGKICEEYKLAGIVNGAPVELYAWKEDGKYYCQNASNFKVAVNESLKKEKCYEDYLMNLAFRTINESEGMGLSEFGEAVAANLSRNTNTDWYFVDIDIYDGTTCVTLSDTNDDHYTFCKEVKELSDTEAKDFALAFEDYINSGEEPDEVDESLTEAVEDPFETLIDNVYEAIAYEHLWADLTDRRVTGDKLQLAYEVNGDWKHEHLRFSNYIMPKCCADLGLVIEKHWESDVEDNDSDTYWSIHHFVISKGRGLRNVQ